MKQLEDDTKHKANKLIAQQQANRQQETSQIGRLLLIYVDEQVNDATPLRSPSASLRHHAKRHITNHWPTLVRETVE